MPRGLFFLMASVLLEMVKALAEYIPEVGSLAQCMHRDGVPLFS
jgi:hypothetical protein